MIKILSLLLGIANCLMLSGAEVAEGFVDLGKQVEFLEFASACKKLPTFRELFRDKISTDPTHISYSGLFLDAGDFMRYRGVTFEQFETALDQFLATTKRSSLSNSTAWLEPEKAPTSTDLFFDSRKNGYLPYVQKLVLEQDSIVAMRGDLHGDIHSLIQFIEFLQKNGFMDGFKIIKPNFTLIFLGDYVDRGTYGVEVLYTIMRLKSENPAQVVLVRGNHEDIQLTQQYGFYSEFKYKFKDAHQAKVADTYERKLVKFYDLLPHALFLGCKTESTIEFAQCCHGGIEIGYDPKALLSAPDSAQYQWIGQLYCKTHCNYMAQASPDLENSYSYKILKANCLDYLPVAPAFFISGQAYINGFLWSDFEPNRDEPLSYRPGRGFKFSKDLTQEVLKFFSTPQATLCGIFRAHQHNAQNTDLLMNMMLDQKGLARLWNSGYADRFHPSKNMVYTFLLSPDSFAGMATTVFRGFEFDTWALVKLKPEFERWDVQLFNNQVYATDKNLILADEFLPLQDPLNELTQLHPASTSPAQPASSDDLHEEEPKIHKFVHDFESGAFPSRITQFTYETQKDSNWTLVFIAQPCEFYQKDIFQSALETLAEQVARDTEGTATLLTIDWQPKLNFLNHVTSKSICDCADFLVRAIQRLKTNHDWKFICITLGEATNIINNVTQKLDSHTCLDAVIHLASPIYPDYRHLLPDFGRIKTFINIYSEADEIIQAGRVYHQRKYALTDVGDCQFFNISAELNHQALQTHELISSQFISCLLELLKKIKTEKPAPGDYILECASDSLDLHPDATSAC